MEKQKRLFLPLDPTSALGARFVGTHFPDQTPLLVQRTRSMEVGMCYSNCRSVAQAEGGSVRCGFIILLCQGLFIEAMHHAVWENPQGVFEDVTAPPYDGMDAKRACWFYPDETILGDDDAAIPSIFRRLTDNPNVIEWVHLCITRMRAYKELLALDHTYVTDANGIRQMAFQDYRVGPRGQLYESLSRQMKTAWQKRWR